MIRSLPYLSVLLAIICMSTASIMIRACTAPALIIAMYRVFFTSALAAAIQGRNIKSSIIGMSRADLAFTLTAGVFLALHFGFWITSLDYTSVSSSVLFTNLQVIFVLLFSVLFLKEKINLKAFSGIIIALSGCLLIAQGDLHRGRLAGDMMALLSGAFIAFYIMAGRRVRTRVDAMTYTALVSITAGILLFLACIISGLNFTGYPVVDWGYFILLAAGPGIAGHGLIIWALKYVKAPIVAVSILGESVGASILAYIFFNEILLWYQLTGGLFILIGIFIAAVNEKPNNKLN